MLHAKCTVIMCAVRAYMRVCTSVHVRMRVRARACVHACVCACSRSCLRACVRVCACLFTCARMHARTHMHIGVCRYIITCTYIAVTTSPSLSAVFVASNHSHVLRSPGASRRDTSMPAGLFICTPAQIFVNWLG